MISFDSVNKEKKIEIAVDALSYFHEEIGRKIQEDYSIEGVISGESVPADSHIIELRRRFLFVSDYLEKLRG